MCHKTLSLLILLLSSCNANNKMLPVFLLDDDNIMLHLHVDPNPFSKITTEYFTEVVNEVISKSKIVLLFIEETFCAEDISTKDREGSPFSHLREGLMLNKVKYFPGVENPYDVFKKAYAKHDLNVFHLNSTGTKITPQDLVHKHYYVYFSDNENETRTDVLRRHDLIIHEWYLQLHQLVSGSVVAFYTGIVNPVSFERLGSMHIKTHAHSYPGVTIGSRGALFRFSGVFATAPNRNVKLTQTPKAGGEKWTRRHMTTNVAYTDFELQFNFSFKKENWIVDNVALLEGGEEVGRTAMSVGAPWDWSYVCSEPLMVINTRDGSAIIINRYQIQPFKRSGREGEDDEAAPEESPESAPAPDTEEGSEGGSKTFGKSVNCGPYFNCDILAALFVVFICLSVLTYGVVSVYNCHSNDRYDDPQNKPLVIAAEGDR